MNVGDTVYIVEQNGGNRPHMYTGKIDKIGKKYFYAGDLNFDKITHEHTVKNYSQFTTKCYFDKNEYYKIALGKYLAKQVRITISTYTVTDEQYERIAEILEIKKPTAEELGICFE